ncbi:MAG: PAS domain-containing sensor histidine kinase [Candidatus Omnitrophica bacterium]|nr:PAS domain-containing sensor histidine kinase [Candidatus Omnitrophota bacterium]
MNTAKPSENIRSGWPPFVLIAATTLATIAVSIYCLSSGWFIIFQNLFYIPIIIACLYYLKRGFVFSVILAFIYFALIIAFTKDPSVIKQALIRIVIFASVAGITVFLSIKRKRAEEELQVAKAALEKSKQSFFNIVEKSADGIIVTDNNGIVCFCNPSAESIFGVNKDDFIGKSFGIAVVSGQMNEIGIIRQDGQAGIGEIRSSQTEWDGRQASLILVRDITERKKAEEALTEAVRVKSDFTGIVSHELRTPLASIKEGVSVVLDKITGDINGEQEKYLNIVKNNVDRLDRLISAVLDFQKFESGKMEFNIEDSDMNKIVSGIQDSMMLLFKKKGLAFEVRLCENLPQASFDRDKIIQVLTNLVNNALKFTEKGGIVISTAKGDNFVQVMVKDTGIGIKEENMAKLFHEFTQLQRKVGGTGLGLSICKKIIEAHRGKIWVESEFGKGTAFYFSLPIKERRA